MYRGFLAAAGLATLSIVGSARAVLIIPVLSDNFDSYANQAAFQAAWPSIATTTDTTKQNAELSAAQFVSSPNSVHVPVSTTATASSTEFRNRRSFAESGTIGIGDQLIWNFDFYDSGGTGNPQRNYANIQDTTGPSATNQLISLGLSNNELAAASGGNFYMARILGYTTVTVDPDGGPNEDVVGAGAYFKLNDYGVGLRSLGWHNLKAILSTDDGQSTDFKFYVDNVLAETVNNVGTAATIRSYDNMTIGSGFTNGGTDANFDNMSLEFATVPEPASLGLLAAGGLFLGHRRLRHRRR